MPQEPITRTLKKSQSCAQRGALISDRYDAGVLGCAAMVAVTTMTSCGRLGQLQQETQNHTMDSAATHATISPMMSAHAHGGAVLGTRCVQMHLPTRRSSQTTLDIETHRLTLPGPELLISEASSQCSQPLHFDTTGSCLPKLQSWSTKSRSMCLLSTMYDLAVQAWLFISE